MFIYAERNSPRLSYIAEFAGRQCIGEPFRVTQNAEEYRNSAFPKINYSDRALQDGEIWIRPNGLLFENSIKQQAIHCSELDGLKIFFQNEGSPGFDVFAASFFLISRYEEYLPHVKDEYGRYGHVNSIAYKNGFLDQPLVNKWMGLLRKKLGTEDPDRFEFLPTYDIDEAWSYRHKPWFRNMGGMYRDLLKGDRERVRLRNNVRAGKRQDPYDSFEWLYALHEKFILKPLYFFLVAEANGKYDKNIPPSNEAMMDLIKNISSRYEIGVHPSWQSGDRSELLKKEISLLQQITGKNISVSRQHFLRFNLPEGYRRLIDAGIKEDHSMGYGTINGFRASVSSSFYWYDLERDQVADLFVHPFCFMDANSYYEQRQTPQQTSQELLKYLHEVRSVNGRMITLWHNTFLGDEERFSGWGQVYEEFVKEVKIAR